MHRIYIVCIHPSILDHNHSIILFHLSFISALPGSYLIVKFSRIQYIYLSRPLSNSSSRSSWNNKLPLSRCYSLLLELLLFEFVLYVWTERHRTLLLLTVLGMITTEGDELFADGTATVGYPLAVLGVLDDTFHLLARK